MKVTVLSYTPHPTELIAAAGRVCYDSQRRGKENEFIAARVRDGHLSIVEHASITFLVEGISRACSHQLVRHRHLSFSQQSQRYVNMAEPEFVVPPLINDNPQALEILREHFVATAKAYRALRELGILKEDARFVLPNATATTIMVSGNLRAWREFFQKRLVPAAQWEIRELAYEMWKLAVEICPAVFKDLEGMCTTK